MSPRPLVLPPALPATYQGRLQGLRDATETLRWRLEPLQDALRAYCALGGTIADLVNDTEKRWVLPAGATLAIRAGYYLHTDITGIGEGIVPAPDPLQCLAGALHSEEEWRRAYAAFSEALAWCGEQADRWGTDGDGAADPD